MALAQADERRQLFRLIGMANGYDNEADRKLVVRRIETSADG